MTWVLVLILNFGTPAAKATKTIERYPTWAACISTAFDLMSNVPPGSAVRCEPHGLDV